MSLKRFQKEKKVIELGKFDKGGTSIMRKATDIRLVVVEAQQYNYGVNLGGTVTDATLGGATIDLTVQQYFVGPNDASGNPTYGDLMTGPGLTPNYPASIAAIGKDYVKVVYVKDAAGEYQLDAAGNRIIDLQDPECGKFLISVADAQLADAQDGGILDTDYMYDNEFFRQIYYSNIVIVSQIVERFILGHAIRGKFNI